MSRDILDKINSITSKEDTREFENSITNISKLLSSDNFSSILEKFNFEDNYLNKLKYYCIIFTYKRRQEDINFCIRFYNENKLYFKESFIVKHLYSILLKRTGKIKDIYKSIEIAREIQKKEINHIGALHNLAEGSVLICEESKTLTSTDIERNIDESLEILDDIIEISPNYAKFYATKSRAYIIQENYNLAKENIHKAIDKEDSNANDYSIRINQYLVIKSKIETKKQIKILMNDVKDHTNKIETEIRKSNLELLSFFVAVISFIYANVQIMTKFKLVEAIQISFSFSSAILIAMTGFVSIYGNKNEFKRFIVPVVVAILLLLIATQIPNIF